MVHQIVEVQQAGTISRKGRAGGSSGGSGVAEPGSPVSPDAVLPQPAPSDYTPYGNLGGAGGPGSSSGYKAWWRRRCWWCWN